MATTLKKLAEHTGYSLSTISRVLNNDPTITVGEQTRRKILEAAHQLGYTGGSGRRVRPESGPSMTIAIAEMLTPAQQMSDPYFLYLKNFIEQTCFEYKIQTVPLYSDGNQYMSLSQSEIDGIIAIGIFSKNQIEALSQLSSNITFLDSSPDELHYDSVILNFELGIAQAIDHLRSWNHTKIGFVGPKRLIDEQNTLVPEPRRRFFEHYMRESGIFRPEFVIEAPMRDKTAAAREIVEHISSGVEMPTALVTVNEETAIGVIQALHSLDLRAPDDLSIVSFNDTVMSSIISPALTSVSTHLDYMSATAVKLVSERASTPQHRPVRHFPQKVVIPPTLVVRESTAPYLSE